MLCFGLSNASSAVQRVPGCNYHFLHGLVPTLLFVCFFGIPSTMIRFLRPTVVTGILLLGLPGRKCEEETLPPPPPCKSQRESDQKCIPKDVAAVCKGGGVEVRDSDIKKCLSHCGKPIGELVALSIPCERVHALLTDMRYSSFIRYPQRVRISRIPCIL